MNYGALLCSTGLVAWAAMMRALSGTWLQPSAFFALWWCFAGILPLILVPKDRVGTNAILWLLVANIAFSIGAVVGNWGFKTRRLAQPPATTDSEIRIFGLLCLLSVVLGVGSSVAFISGTGVAFSDLFDIRKLVVVSNQAYFARYAEGVVAAPPRLSQALLPFVYLAPALGGAVFVLGRQLKWKILGVLSFLPAIAVTILQTTKAAMLFGIVLWLSSYFGTRLRKGKLAVFTRGHLLVALGVGAVVVTLFLAVGLARLATTDVTLAKLVFKSAMTAAFGHMAVFSKWLTEFAGQPFSPTFGKVSFSGPLELLGLGQRIPGLFEDIVELVSGDTTNIYTGFRPLIQDFTVPGALAVLALVGLVGGMGFRLVAAGKASALPLLMAAYVTIFWTPITWFWIYNSLTATVVAIGFTVMFIRVWRGTRRLQTA
jgi:oligosaccharide repeat unit polymerase